MDEEKKARKRAYYQTEEYKAKNRERARLRYHTTEGQEYEKKKKTSLSNRFSMAPHHAEKKMGKSRTFHLTKEEYFNLLSQPCYYCNRSLSEETGIGLDRKDNNGDYTIDNVVQCCGICNSRRGSSMSSEEFLRQTILNGYRV